MKAIRINSIYNDFYAITEFNLNCPIYKVKAGCVSKEKLRHLSKDTITINYDIISNIILTHGKVPEINLGYNDGLKDYEKIYKPEDYTIYEVLYEIADIGFIDNGNVWELLEIEPNSISLDNNKININCIEFYSTVKSNKLSKYIVSENNNIYAYKVKLNDFMIYCYLANFDIIVKDEVVKNDIIKLSKFKEEYHKYIGDVEKWKKHKLTEIATKLRVLSVINEKQGVVF